MITLDKEIQNLLLNGGTVVLKEDGGKNTTILIRMPKGQFIQDDRAEYENNFFEYVICQNSMNVEIISICSYTSDTLLGAKKKTWKKHSERSYK
tara:strand:+ start:4573 stop:4854 length:282 start_codon:yes stop_codon:yes gene_type:complete